MSVVPFGCTVSVHCVVADFYGKNTSDLKFKEERWHSIEKDAQMGGKV
jgi:hypothetical protein